MIKNEKALVGLAGFGGPEIVLRASGGRKVRPAILTTVSKNWRRVGLRAGLLLEEGKGTIGQAFMVTSGYYVS